ncbi:hypothetical protein RO575_02065 [Methylomonas sp. MO1]|nr:hypothetical protein [Methylomonas sp. MO1]MDT4288332.1 hypothetical protein [Methylomonas sp. MO1]
MHNRLAWLMLIEIASCMRRLEKKSPRVAGEIKIARWFAGKPATFHASG